MWKEIVSIEADLTDPVCRFAAEELTAYINRAGGSVKPVGELPHPDGNNACRAILRTAPEVFDTSERGTQDEFRISHHAAGRTLLLEAVNSRSLLFAVYSYLQDFVGRRTRAPSAPANPAGTNALSISMPACSKS